MSKQEVFKIGARLLGIYFFALGFITIPQVFMGWELAASTPNVRRWAVVLASAAQSALMIGAGVLLTFLGRESSSAQPQLVRESLDHSVFPSLLQLLGIYLALGALGPLVREVSESVIVSASWQFHAARVGAELVSFIVGLFLVVRAPRVARWLNDVQKRAA